MGCSNSEGICQQNKSKAKKKKKKIWSLGGTWRCHCESTVVQVSKVLSSDLELIISSKNGIRVAQALATLTPDVLMFLFSP